MAMDPFNLLLEIEQQNLTYAKPLPEQKLEGQFWLGLGLGLAQTQTLLIPLAEVKEILLVPPMTRVPESVDWFLGISNRSGRILPITDLQNFIFDLPLIINKFTRVLVVAHEHALFGFAVEQVLGIKKMKNADFKESTEAQVKESYFAGSFEWDHKQWPVLSLMKLIQSLKFNHIVESWSNRAEVASDNEQ